MAQRWAPDLQASERSRVRLAVGDSECCFAPASIWNRSKGGDAL